MFKDFVGLYKMSKTLRFELKPVGATLANMKKSGVLERDFVRAEKYQMMKDILDLQHKALLERTLSSVDNFTRCMGEKERKKYAVILADNGVLNWEILAKAFEDFRTSAKDKESREKLESVCASYRTLIAEIIKSDDKYKCLAASTPKDFIKEFLANEGSGDAAEKLAVETFNGFACYFTGFQENRSNIYSDKAQKTSAANRAVNENFPRYLKCCSLYDYVAKKYPDVIKEVELALGEEDKEISVSKCLKVGKYSDYLSQRGIEKINTLIGIFNQQINLKKQSDETARQDKKLGQMPILYKQILSDRESASFSIEKFEADADVLSSIKGFGEFLENNNVLTKLYNLIATVRIEDTIFVKRESLSEISNNLYGDWHVLSAAIERVAEEKFSNITAKGQREKAIKQWISRNEYPLTDFVDAVRYDDKSNDWINIDICDYWKNEKAEELFKLVESSWKALLPILDTDEKIGLRDRKDDVKAIKEYLDSVLNVIRLVKPLSVGAELERDTDFYGQFDELYDILDDVVPLYNQARNYITSKPSEEKKLKLMFDSPTLAKGWDQNQEEANKAVLLEKGGQFYLGIVNAKQGKKERPDFNRLKSDTLTGCYRKIIYKLLPNPHMSLPKAFFSNKGLPIYKPSSILLERFKNGDYKKGATFDLQFCHQLIDFFKKSISIHPDWSKFGFEFSPTSSYGGIDDFYREISNQGYKISFDGIDEKVIDSFVDSGALYLFKLHNKDFSSGSTGRQNLHTIYWRMLFASENLEDVIYKLNGEAELFYRRASIKNPYIHKLGKKLVNRIDKDGKRIPDIAFSQLVKLADDEITAGELSGVAKDLYEAGKVEIRDVKHEIIKDRRFAEDKFFFHVPITINAKANDKASRFNDLVNDVVRNFEDVNIIGIDRGERHLLYVTVIDSKGKILKQRSFNTIDIDRYDGKRIDVDYHAKLDQMEKDRDKARKSWSEIGKIKDLKSGYLSMVVHEIAKLMVKYNAIVVLEDLNGGFKRGRSAIEKQVYQKFEKAMIDKLNYLVFKDSEPLSLGGALRGYQLADKFESFEKLGKQTGFIYYVPAAYTSKIDPTTGFTNIFDFKKCTSAEGIKRFFNLFDSIKYSETDKAFIFAFDYNKFDTRFPSWNSKWEVYSASRRLVYSKDQKTDVEINPTNVIIDALVKRGVAITDEFNLGLYLKETDATRENASLFKSVFYAFERTLQMRNSSAKTGEDYIESPVKNSSGGFFDSRKCGKELPENADANGAYHIALKGLMMVKELKTKETPKLAIKNEAWLEFVQRMRK